MKILALEFSSELRSVAIAESGTGVPPVVLAVAVEASPRSVGALALVDQALRLAKLEREQIECIAVGLGPGSYAGIRAAISLAQGWQLARGLKLLGVSSAECLTAQAHAAGLRGRVNVVIDAQRNELYLAGYELGEKDWREIEPLRLASLAEARAKLVRGETLVGPEAQRWFAESVALNPDAAMLARLACGRTDFLPGERLEPIYLRETSFVKAPPPRLSTTA